MHFRDFNSVAAELREGDSLRLELNGGESVTGELTAPVILGSPSKSGEITLLIDGNHRRVNASELSVIDLIQ